MPEEIKEPKIESENFKEEIESDIKKLAEEINRIKLKAEMNHISEQELIKKSLSALTPIPKTNQNQTQNQSSGPLPSYTQSFSPEIKLEIEYLLHMAFNDGIFKALKEAQKSKSPVILDAFHDALTGKLYEELKKRNLL